MPQIKESPRGVILPMAPFMPPYYEAPSGKINGDIFVKLPTESFWPSFIGAPTINDGATRVECPKTEGTPEAIDLAFTVTQRRWWFNAYDACGYDGCAFPVFDRQRGWHSCGSKHKLELHHIVPGAYTRYNNPNQDPNDTLGIFICKYHHDNRIHPDVGRAMQSYHDDKDSIKKAIEDHADKAKKGIIYWNTKFDKAMHEIAREVFDNWEQSGHPYPHDPSWKGQRKEEIGWRRIYQMVFG